MGSGKYRITKIARKWDKNENWEKIILKRNIIKRCLLQNMGSVNYVI